MGLEAGTFIADLVSSNPATSDLESQGANHLQLIKSVLQNTFPGANRAVPFPAKVSTAINISVTKAQFNSCLVVDTSGGIVTVTLPALTASDPGWRIGVAKVTTDSNPVLIAPSSGQVYSGGVLVNQARRCIPNIYFDCLWDGARWVIGRCVHVPVATVLEFWGATLPVGFEWANGQTLGSASTNYPEYNSVVGSGLTPDRQGRAGFGKGNMGGADVGRITVAGGNFDGTVLGTTQDRQNWTLNSTQIPAHTHAVSGTTGTQSASHTHASGGASPFAMFGAAGATFTTPSTGPLSWGSFTATGTQSVDHTHSFSATSGSAGGGSSHPIIPPAIIMNYIVVTE